MQKDITTVGYYQYTQLVPLGAFEKESFFELGLLVLILGGIFLLRWRLDQKEKPDPE